MLNGQAVDDLKLHLAAFDFVIQQVLQHTCRFFGDDRADAVAAAHADGQLIQLIVIDEILLFRHAFHTSQLGTDDFVKLLMGSSDFLFHIHDKILLIGRQ